MDKESTLELVSSITEFNDMSEMLDDDTLDKALAYVVKLCMQPDIPPAKAPKLIIQLQAYSAAFAAKATYYTSVEKGKAGSLEYKKKNVYYTMADQCDKLAAALKYTVKINSL